LDTLAVLNRINQSVPGVFSQLSEPMSKHTSFGIGGPADILVSVGDKHSLAALIKLMEQIEVPYFCMGNGTNLLVSDKGVRGVVIKTVPGENSIRLIDENTIEADCGALLRRVSAAALHNSLTGLEFASGIPGSVGGALCMNAGAYGGEMKDVAVKTEYVDLNGNIGVLNGEENKFGYRKSVFSEGDKIALSATFKLEKGNEEEIKALMDEYSRRRRTTQPLEFPSAGSAFKRPEGYYAGALIQNSGLKGASVGGAQVSQKHAGFIINTGGATCSDVLGLIELVREKVFKDSGVVLEPEIKMVGEF